MKISVFVPVYNEERIVVNHLNEIYSFMENHFKDFEIVAVDDSSKDNTGSLVKALEKKKSKLRYMRFENGPSRRENLGVAFRSAKYDSIAYVDLDLAVPLTYFPKLVEQLENENDIVIGSRRQEQSSVERSKYRLILSNLYHSFIHLFFNSKIKDYQCGFKLFKKKVLFDLLNRVGYDKKLQRGWFWDAEMLINAEKKGYKIKEVPVKWKEGKKSSFNLRKELKVIPYIIKLRFKV